MASSALVDSASPGRNDVDSLLSVSANFRAGRRPRRRRAPGARREDDPLGAAAAAKVKREPLQCDRIVRCYQPRSGEPARSRRSVTGRLAGEALAHVGGGAAVDRRARPRSSAAALAALRAAGQDEVGAQLGADDAPRASAQRRRRRAPPRCRGEVEVERRSRWAKAWGWRGASSAKRRSTPDRVLARSACSPVSAARRSRPRRRPSCRTGSGGRSSSLRRAISARGRRRS